MKKTKKFLAIKILCFALSGLLLSSSVFMSNQKTITVNAMDEEEYNHWLRCITAVAAVVGIWNIPAGIVFEALGVIGVSVVDYIQDNGDGTYTIDEQLFQEVLNAMNDIESSMFGDEDVVKFFSGDSVTYEGYAYTSGVNSNKVTIEYVHTFSASETYPICAVFNDLDTSNDYINLHYGSGLSTYKTLFKIEQYRNGSLYDSSTSSNYSIPLRNVVYSDSTYDYAFNFPIFSNADDAKAYLTDGTGYEKALNYTDTELFEYSSRYTGTYNGGNVTISATKLNAIEDKLDELNTTEKSTDEKVEEIVDWLNDVEDDSDDNSGGDSGDDSGDDSGNNSGDDSGDDDSGGGFLSSIGDFFGKILDFILSLVEKLFDPILKLLDMFMELINKVIDIIPTGFTSFLGAMFPFFPEEWSTIISLGLLASIIIGLIFRRK